MATSNPWADCPNEKTGRTYGSQFDLILENLLSGNPAFALHYLLEAQRCGALRGVEMVAKERLARDPKVQVDELVERAAELVQLDLHNPWGADGLRGFAAALLGVQETPSTSPAFWRGYDAAHQLDNDVEEAMGRGSPPHDAATATGMYDHD